MAICCALKLKISALWNIFYAALHQIIPEHTLTKRNTEKLSLLDYECLYKKANKIIIHFNLT
jgi:hypothetical protein